MLFVGKWEAALQTWNVAFNTVSIAPLHCLLFLLKADNMTAALFRENENMFQVTLNMSFLQSFSNMLL